jgi:hypothetical protein
VFPFAKGPLFMTGAIGLLLPVTIAGAIHFALRGSVADSVVLSVVSVPLLLIDVWIWRRLLTDKPGLILKPDVLEERASLFGAGQVARHEIAGVRVGQSGFWRMVYLDLPDTSRRHSWTPAIPAFLLGFSAEALADHIRSWLHSGPRH